MQAYSHTSSQAVAKSTLYTERMGKVLENVTLQYSSKDLSQTHQALTQLFDLSLLRFQQRDDIAEHFRRYSHKVAVNTQPGKLRLHGASFLV